MMAKMHHAEREEYGRDRWLAAQRTASCDSAMIRHSADAESYLHFTPSTAGTR